MEITNGYSKLTNQVPQHEFPENVNSTIMKTESVNSAIMSTENLASEIVSTENVASVTMSTKNDAFETTQNQASEIVSTQNHASEISSTPNQAYEIVSTENEASEIVSTKNQASEIVSSQNRVSEIMSTQNEASEIVSTENASEIIKAENDASGIGKGDNDVSEIGKAENDASETVSTENETSQTFSTENETSNIVSINNDTFVDKTTSVEDPTSDSPEKKNPFLIASVIECICGFLNLRQIKKVRFVCKEWNHAAVPFLRQLSRITFGYPSHPKTFSKSIPNFKNLFERSSSKIPFTSTKLTLRGKSKSPWSDSILRDFFDTVGKDITDLAIDKIKLENSLDTYDMSHLLKALHITKLVVTHAHGMTKLNFSLDVLIHVKFLNLRECKLIVTNESCMSPVTINLIYCKFVFPSDDTCINQFLKFDNLRQCTIMSYSTSNLSLDLSGKFEVDTMDLTCVKLVNWKYSNWKVKYFNLSGIRFLSSAEENTTIDITNMKMTECPFLPTIPKMVEKLTILNSAPHSDIPSLSLPNLKRLKITAADVKKFQTCENLVSLELEVYRSGENNIEIDWISKNVKNIQIGKTVVITGEGSRRLEKLIFSAYSLKSLRETWAHLKPELIVIRLCSLIRGIRLNFEEDEQGFLFAIDKCITLAIGPVDWEYPGLFKRASVVALVDKKAPYYLFKNHRGVAISKLEFEKMAEL